ncbi:SpvB/TcaC N-terminal domain-containing protein [Streptomyces sp. NPDC050844]|uniref:SpvB/TcaC N-terminal domain-containing protein n=1 Tax=Streptomyces sp. NPDC050844 TaxID=3155790 RepID=UPI0033C03746
MAKAAGTEASILPLPTGGGGQRAIDETFKTDLSTGSGFYQIQLQCPRGINDLTPELGLKYSTGAGNGPFGMGWSLNLPSITRRTERNRPRFGAGSVPDIFYLESKELAPIGGGRFRPLVESESVRIEYDEITDSWTLATKSGTTLHFGLTPQARTRVAAGTLEWCLSRITDLNDNVIEFGYDRDGGVAYLVSVRYAIYELRLSYEQRPDPYSSFRTGDELRTTRRCTAIDLVVARPAVQPVKSYRLRYRQAAYSRVSQLAGAQLVALDPADAAVEHPLEPISFEYTEFDPGACRLRTFTARAATVPPALTEPDLTLLDFDGVGRPGVLELKGGTARFWPSEPDLSWGAPRTVTGLPLAADLSEDALRLADLDGNATADLLVGAAAASGYFPSLPGAGWGPMVRYRQAPVNALATAGARLLDLDGDNRVDLMHADERAFYHYFNEGADGWDAYPVVTPRQHRLEEFPDVDLTDPHVRMADVVGDGRTHLVVLHDGRVTYYPNLGFGEWGAMRAMTNAPRLPRNYDPARLFLSDVTGDGTADVIYVDFDRVRLWLNRCGNGFSDEIVIPGTPPVANSAVLVADMTGSGTSGVLFSYAASLHRPRDYRYLDFSGGAPRPLLLRRITNNMRVSTEITYGSSADWPRDTGDPELAGRAAFLPFPVPVVTALSTTDPATRVTSASRFVYRNGNYDTAERAFLGFGKGERIDEGDASAPARRSVCYFHNDDVALRGAPRRTLLSGAAGVFEEEAVSYAVEPVGQGIRRAHRTAVVKRTYEGGPEYREVRTDYEYDAAGNVGTETVTSSWSDDAGHVHEDVRVTQRSYATDAFGELTGLLCRETVRDGAALVTDQRIFYDGAPFAGLPLGQLTQGNVTRVRRYALPVDAYPAGFPGLDTLGYVRETDPVLGDVYCVDSYAQRLDARGNLIERRDSTGAATEFEFDQHGLYPVGIGFANGLRIRADYEYRYGSITRYVEVTGVEQWFRYDAAGRLTGVFRFDDPPDQPYLSYEYAPAYQVTLTRSTPGGPQNRRIEYLDGLAQPLQVRAEAEDGRVAVSGGKRYNAMGLVHQEQQAYFSTSLEFSVDDQHPATHTSYDYDARGRSVRRTGWDGEVYRTRYELGRVVHTDPLGVDRTEWHDADGRVVAVLEGAYQTRYRYDAVGNRTSVEVNGSTMVTNVFDGLGRRIRSNYRDAGVWHYLYDAAARPVQRVDGKGDVVHRAYDVVGRVTQVRHGGPTGPLQEEYEYDGGDATSAGKLTRVSGPFGEVRYTYGQCQCLRTKTRIVPGLAEPLTVTYTTDNLKRFTKVTYPDGFEQEIVYNAAGLLDSLPGVIDKVHYGPTGRRTRVEFTSGVVTDYAYAPASLRLTRLRTTAPDGTTTYQDLAYDYDPRGSITSAGEHSFTYDALQQLATATGPGFDVAYNIDEWGNLAGNPEQGGQLTHDDPTQPFRITTAPYAYDDAGNLTRSLHNSYAYDARNRLVRVESDSGAVTTHRYDHAGNRVTSTRTEGGVTETTVNFDDIYLLVGGSATKIVFDDHGQAALIRADGTGVVFHTDHLGSHTAESDLISGALLASRGYRPFGTPVLAGPAPASPFGFGGKLFDGADGLVFFGGRYYLPETGRFLTPDPYFLEQQPERFFAAPRSLQLYVYVLNNPLNMVDPYGLFFGIDDLIVAAVGFVVGVGAYLINTAISGGDFSFSEMLFSGLMGAATVWLSYATFGVAGALIVGGAMLAAPAITGALDQAAMGNSFGQRLLGFFSFAIKFASSPVTTTVGLHIGGFGTGFGLWGNVEWFKGGVIAFEYDPSSAAFSAVTLGGTVNIWQGNTSNSAFEHELYHSRQYTYFGDAFVPAWVVGGVWGLISSAIAGSPQWGCFPSADPAGGYGNPLEATAHTVDAGAGCT